jgi:uncharacterized membrane protein (DUF4010 family)
MLLRFFQWLPPESIKILLVLALSLLVGLEREEHKSSTEQKTFGGVRTYPLIGLIGYAMALLGGGQLLPLTLGFAVVGGFLFLSYWHKLSTSEAAGITSEVSALTIYLVGGLVYQGHFWVATTLSVASALLLELKTTLEGLTERVASEEILIFTKFLVLTAVVLPILPNRDFGPFQINPFKTWLVVVAVSTLSYGSYVLQKLTKPKGGVLLMAILGGAYSSTVTTVALAKRASREDQPHLFSGAVLMASGVMYLRLVFLMGLFNLDLMIRLAPSFVGLAFMALAAGWIWSRRPDAHFEAVKREFEPANPLELRAAFFFAILFLAMLVVTHLVVAHLGRAGVYALAAIMGVTDVDPFIMGITQATPTLTPLAVGSASIVIAAASNNLLKGMYAYAFADRKTGIQSLCLLAGLAALGLAPLLWLPT